MIPSATLCSEVYFYFSQAVFYLYLSIKKDHKLLPTGVILYIVVTFIPFYKTLNLMSRYKM